MFKATRIGYIQILAFVLLFISALATSYESPLRYTKYLIFPLIAVYCSFLGVISIDKKLFQNLRLYLVLILVNLATSIVTGTISGRFAMEVGLILLPLLTAIGFGALKKVRLSIIIDRIFLVYITAFVVYNFKSLINLPRLIMRFVDALTLSQFETESWMAFPMGLFSLYYIMEKKHGRALLAIACFLLCFKRIAMVGFATSLIAYIVVFILLKKDFRKAVVVRAFVILNAALIICLFLFIDGFFTKLIYRETGITINHFSQGRFAIYNDAITHFQERIFTGSSLGMTHDFLKYKYTDIEFLHSDILKLILELGIFPFLLWLVGFMYINIFTKKAVCIVLFINILFLSDNVFIYFDTLFLFYIILLKLNQDGEESEVL